jgi:nucleotide-binding universal stress UspA family protein
MAKGYQAEHILALATKQQADLLVLGSRGMTGFTRIQM